MVEIGELSIIVNLDFTNIDKGFVLLERHQDKVEQKNKRMVGDFTRLGGVVGTVAKGFGAVAASTLGLIKLAKDSPALAGSMASLSVSMGRITRSLGEGLQGPVGRPGQETCIRIGGNIGLGRTGGPATPLIPSGCPLRGRSDPRSQGCLGHSSQASQGQRERRSWNCEVAHSGNRETGHDTSGSRLGAWR